MGIVPVQQHSQRRKIGGLILIFSLVMLGIAAVHFWQVGPEPFVPDSTPWVFYLIGLATFVVSILFLSPLSIQFNQPSGWLFLILLLAFAVRLYHFDKFPYGVWGDEAEAGVNAREVLHNPDFRPIYNGSLHMTWPQLWMYAGLLKIFGETSVLSLRLLSVLFGVGAVILGYKVGEQIHSPAFGLWMAFFIAVMRWSITFSRLAITGIETPFFALLTLYLLYRLHRNPHFFNAVLLGLGVGSGLLFYMAFRPIIAGLVVVALLQWRKKILPYFMVAGLTAFLTIFPMLIFAYTNTDVFLRRQRDIWIGNLVPEPYPTLQAALTHNLQAYLRMFHFKGDGWSLYNHQQTPMLDPIMGMLMAVGLVIALIKLKRIENQFFLITFIAALLAGILSINEAHSGRTIGVIAAVAYFCALATLELYKIAQRYISKQTVTIVRAAVAMFIISLNFYTYHHKQAHDYNGWILSAHTQLIVDEIQQNPDAEVYISNTLITLNPTLFIAPDVYNRVLKFETSTFFPIIPQTNQPLLILLEQRDIWIMDYARKLYPKGSFTIPILNRFLLENQANQPPFYMIKLTQEDITNAAEISQTLGLQANFYPNQDWQGPPALTRIDPTPYAYFHEIPFARPYTVTWSGCLNVPATDTYEFYLSTIGYAEFYLDGEKLITTDTATGELKATLSLSAGSIPIEVRYRDVENYSGIYLQWWHSQLDRAPISPTLLTPC